WIISTAQQARPKVIGHKEPVRVQLISLSRLVVTKPSCKTPSILIALLPIQRAVLPLDDETDNQNSQKHRHSREGIPGNLARSNELLEHNSPREQKGDFEIEKNKEN